MKYFKRIVLGLLVGLFVLGFIYCAVNKVTYDSLSIKLQNYLYAKQKDSEENDIPEDCGYDDVGGTPEEQDEYATQNNNYNISDVNQRVRSYLINSIRQSVGYDTVFTVSVQSINNDSEVIVNISMLDYTVTSDNRDFIKAAAIQAIGDDIKLVHDGLYNTYINYGFNINSLDLKMTAKLDITIIECKGGNMGYTDNSIDLGL